MTNSPLTELRELNAAMRELEAREQTFLSKDHTRHSISLPSSTRTSPQAHNTYAHASSTVNSAYSTTGTTSRHFGGVTGLGAVSNTGLHTGQYGVGNSSFRAHKTTTGLNESALNMSHLNSSFHTHAADTSVLGGGGGVGGAIPVSTANIGASFHGGLTPRHDAMSFTAGASAETPAMSAIGIPTHPHTVGGNYGNVNFTTAVTHVPGPATELGFIPHRGGAGGQVPPGTSIAGSPNGGSLLAALKVLQDKIRILEQERDESVMEKASLTKEMEQLRSQVTESIQKEVSNSQSRQEAATAEITFLRQDIDALRSRHTSLTAESRSLTREVETAEAEINHLRQIGPQGVDERRQSENQLLAIEAKITHDNRESSARFHELEAITRNFQASLDAAQHKMHLLQASLAEEKSYRVAAEEEKARVDGTVQKVLNLNETLVAKLYNTMQVAQENPKVVVKTVRRKIRAKVDTGLKKKKSSRVVQASQRVGGGYIINPAAPRLKSRKKRPASARPAQSNEYVDLMLNDTAVRVPAVPSPGRTSAMVTDDIDATNLESVIHAIEAEKSVMQRDYEQLLHSLQHSTHDDSHGTAAELDTSIRGMIDKITEKEKQLATLRDLSHKQQTPKKKKRVKSARR